MPLQNILVTIAGANPQTKLVQINVDPASGQGTGTFSYQGVNSGTDTITATAEVDGSQETSNTAQVNWQQTNGQIQIGSLVTAYMWNDSSHGTDIVVYPKFNQNDPAAAGAGAINGLASSSPTGLAILSTSNGFVGSATGNSLIIDYPTTGSANDIAWETLSASGAIVGSTDPFPGTDANFNLVLIATLVVPDSNTHTLGVTNENDAMIGIGGGAVFTHATGFPGQTMSAMQGYPLALYSYSSDGYVSSSASASIRFPAPGFYPIEVDWDYWSHSGRTLHVTFDGSELAPVTLSTAPPTATASGNLTVTPTGGATNLKIQGQTITLTVTLTGVTFTVTPYLPIFEGVQGSVFISNVAGSTQFNFPTLPGGGSVNYTAADAIFTLAGDNTSWQNRLGVVPVSGGYEISYNGNATDPNVAVTNLTVEQQDIAWFNTSNNSLDLYSVTSAGGGVLASIPVYWLVSPTVPSVAPSSLLANGQQQTLTVTLAKPLPPVQKNIVATFTASAGMTVNETIPIFNSLGFLTGWTLLVTPPSSGGTINSTISITASDTLTYLSGTSIVTGVVNYFSNTPMYTVALNPEVAGGGGGGTPSNPYVSNWGVTINGTVVTLQASISASTNTFGNCQFLAAVYPNSVSQVPPLGNFEAAVAPTSVTQSGGLWVAVYTVSQTNSTIGEVFTPGPPGTSQAQVVGRFGLTETNTDGYTTSYADPEVYS